MFAKSPEVRYLCAFCLLQVVATSLLNGKGQEGWKGNSQVENSSHLHLHVQCHHLGILFFFPWVSDFLILCCSQLRILWKWIEMGSLCRLVDVYLGYGLKLWHGFILLTWILVLRVQLLWVPGQGRVTQFTEYSLWPSINQSSTAPLWTLTALVSLESILMACTLSYRVFPWYWHQALWDLQATLHLQRAGWTLQEVQSFWICWELLAASTFGSEIQWPKQRIWGYCELFFVQLIAFIAEEIYTGNMVLIIKFIWIFIMECWFSSVMIN